MIGEAIAIGLPLPPPYDASESARGRESFPWRIAPRNNQRFRLINRATNQAVFSILESDYIAVRRFSKSLHDLAGKHPIVTMKNSGSRFNNNSGHKGIQSPTLNYSGIPSGVEESLEIRTEMSRLRST
jgi:hypothetical protein